MKGDERRHGRFRKKRKKAYGQEKESSQEKRTGERRLSKSGPATYGSVEKRKKTGTVLNNVVLERKKREEIVKNLGSGQRGAVNFDSRKEI